MRVLVSGILAAVAFGAIAAFVLSKMQEPAYESYATSSTRVGQPGTNLVGKSWTGNPRLEPGGS
jgi:hypothetical protein